MLNSKICVFALLIVAATQVVAQERIEFKGVPLGATIAEFREKNPLFVCYSSSFCTLDGFEVNKQCRTIKSGIERDHPSATLSPLECERAAEAAATYGNRKAQMNVTFRDGVLSRSTVNISPESFDQITEALTAKYGPPKSSKDEVIQNRAGAKFNNRTMVWSINGDEIYAARYGSNVTRGLIAVAEKQWVDEQKAKAEKSVKTAPKDL
jgi:hypothetical protein